MNMGFSEKHAQRRRLAVNLGSKSADSPSVEYSRTLPRHRLDLPPTLFHDASAGWSKLVQYALRLSPVRTSTCTQAGLYGCVRMCTDVYGECRVVCTETGFSEKHAQRRRLAVNLGSKSADSPSVEYSRTLPRHRLDLPPTLFHDASAGWSKLVQYALRLSPVRTSTCTQAGLYGCVRMGVPRQERV